MPTKKQRLSEFDTSMPVIPPQNSKRELEAQSSVLKSWTSFMRTPTNRPSKPLQPLNVMSANILFLNWIY